MKKKETALPSLFHFPAAVGGEMADLPTNMDGLNYTENSTEYNDFEPGQHYLSLTKTEKNMIDMVTKNFANVVLDEPTAALDPISEYEVYKNFDKLVHGKTAIYISHRLSSCRFCDRIIVLEDGSVVEEGSHEKLIENTKGLYFKMYNTQAKHCN